MKGLDDFITGKNDPNAPFNQTDWTEHYTDALDKCDWITEAMLEDDETQERLGDIMAEVHGETVSPDKYYNRRDEFEFLKANAQIMADKAKAKWEAEQLKEAELLSKSVKLTPKQKELILTLRKDGHKLQRSSPLNYCIVKNFRKVKVVNVKVVLKLREIKLLSEWNTITKYGRNCTIA